MALAQTILQMVTFTLDSTDTGNLGEEESIFGLREQSMKVSLLKEKRMVRVGGKKFKKY